MGLETRIIESEPFPHLCGCTRLHCYWTNGIQCLLGCRRLVLEATSGIASMALPGLCGDHARCQLLCHALNVTSLIYLLSYSNRDMSVLPFYRWA